MPRHPRKKGVDNLHDQSSQPPAAERAGRSSRKASDGVNQITEDLQKTVLQQSTNETPSKASAVGSTNTKASSVTMRAGATPAPEVKSTDSVDDMDFLFLDLTEPAEAAPTPTRLSDIRRRCEQLGASDLQAFHPDHTQYGDSIDLEYILEMRSLVIDIKNRPGFYFRPMLDAVRYAIDNRPVRISVAVVLKILRAQSIGAVEICDRSRDPTAKPPSTPRPQNAPRIVRVEDMPFTLLKDGEFFVKREVLEEQLESVMAEAEDAWQWVLSPHKVDLQLPPSEPETSLAGSGILSEADVSRLVPDVKTREAIGAVITAGKERFEALKNEVKRTLRTLDFVPGSLEDFDTVLLDRFRIALDELSEPQITQSNAASESAVVRIELVFLLADGMAKTATRLISALKAVVPSDNLGVVADNVVRQVARETESSLRLLASQIHALTASLDSLGGATLSGDVTVSAVSAVNSTAVAVVAGPAVKPAVSADDDSKSAVAALAAVVDAICLAGRTLDAAITTVSGLVTAGGSSALDVEHKVDVQTVLPTVEAFQRAAETAASKARFYVAVARTGAGAVERHRDEVPFLLQQAAFYSACASVARSLDPPAAAAGRDESVDKLRLSAVVKTNEKVGQETAGWPLLFTLPLAERVLQVKHQECSVGARFIGNFSVERERQAYGAATQEWMAGRRIPDGRWFCELIDRPPSPEFPRGASGPQDPHPRSISMIIQEAGAGQTNTKDLDDLSKACRVAKSEYSHESRHITFARPDHELRGLAEGPLNYRCRPMPPKYISLVQQGIQQLFCFEPLTDQVCVFYELARSPVLPDGHDPQNKLALTQIQEMKEMLISHVAISADYLLWASIWQPRYFPGSGRSHVTAASFTQPAPSSSSEINARGRSKFGGAGRDQAKPAGNPNSNAGTRAPPRGNDPPGMASQLAWNFDNINPKWTSPDDHRGTRVLTAVRRLDGAAVVLKQCPARIAMPEIRAHLYLQEAVVKHWSSLTSVYASPTSTLSVSVGMHPLNGTGTNFASSSQAQAQVVAFSASESDPCQLYPLIPFINPLLSVFGQHGELSAEDHRTVTLVYPLLDRLDSSGFSTEATSLSWFWRYSVELMQAVTGLHALNLVHRDIKPENVMRDRKTGQLRLIDLELALWPANDLPNASLVGTLGWLPREESRERWPYNALATEAFSVGAVVFHFLLYALRRATRFYSPAERYGYDVRSVDRLLSDEPLMAQHGSWLHRLCRHVLAEMLRFNPMQRLSVSQALIRMRECHQLYLDSQGARATSSTEVTAHPIESTIMQTARLDPVVEEVAEIASNGKMSAATVGAELGSGVVEVEPMAMVAATALVPPPQSLPGLQPRSVNLPSVAAEPWPSSELKSKSRGTRQPKTAVGDRLGSPGHVQELPSVSSSVATCTVGTENATN